MAFGDGGTDSADLSQVSAQALAESTSTTVKNTQITSQVLAEQVGDVFVSTYQVGAHSLVQQSDTPVRAAQVTAQILVLSTPVASGAYCIRRSTVN